MKKCKVLIIFIFMVLLTGSSFLTYSVNIDSKQDNYLRQIGAEESADEARLDYLYLYDYKIEPELNDDTLVYEAKVSPKTKSLKISYRPISKYTTCEIKDNDNLKNGSIVKIICTSQTGYNVKEYNIKIIFSNSKLVMRILIGILMFIIIVALIFAIIYVLYLKGYIYFAFLDKENRPVKNVEGNYVK